MADAAETVVAPEKEAVVAETEAVVDPPVTKETEVPTESNATESPVADAPVTTEEPVETPAATVETPAATETVEADATQNSDAAPAEDAAAAPKADEGEAESSPEKPLGEHEGTVKFYLRAKNFGFITSDSGTEIFVHSSSVTGKPLQEGDKVRYDEGYDDNKQQTVATNVTGGTGDASAPTDRDSGGKRDGKSKGKGKGYGGGYNSKSGGYKGGKGKGKYSNDWGSRGGYNSGGGYYNSGKGKGKKGGKSSYGGGWNESNSNLQAANEHRAKMIRKLIDEKVERGEIILPEKKVQPEAAVAENAAAEASQTDVKVDNADASTVAAAADGEKADVKATEEPAPHKEVEAGA